LKGWRRDWKIELIEKTIRLGLISTPMHCVSTGSSVR
jgi:hypothetical protein